MKLKLKTWRNIAILAISLAIPAAAEGGKQSRDVVAAGKGGTTTMKTKSLKQPKQTKPAVQLKDLGAKKTPKAGGKKTPPPPIYIEHVIDQASPVILLKRSSKKPERKLQTKKAEGLPDAKEPKETRQTKPVVRTHNLAAKSKVKKGGTKKPIKFGGIDGEFQDKDHKNWSVLEKPAAPTKPVKGKVKVSDIPIIKTVDKATAE